MMMMIVAKDKHLFHRDHTFVANTVQGEMGPAYISYGADFMKKPLMVTHDQLG